MGPLALIFVLGLFTPCTLAIVSLMRRLRRKRASAPWWIAFIALASIGVAAGGWCAFHFEYRLNDHYCVASFPLPVVFFHLEDGQWVDFPVPPFQAWASIFTNIIAITSLATSPLWVLSCWQQRHEPPER